MARAIAPSVEPTLPEGMTGWARSTRRRGGMFHAHVLGHTACGSLQLDRHESAPPKGLGEMQYWGVCPVCHRKGGN